MENKINLGKAIKYLRKKKGLSQEKFAEKIDSDQAYVSQIERGIFNPSVKYIEKICKELEVPLVFLVWHSTTEEDVSKEKREAFRMLKPSIDNIFNDLLKQ